MVDSNKRRTLLTLGGIAAVPLASGLLASQTVAAGIERHISTQVLSGSDSLAIAIIPGDAPMMRVTNTSDKLAIVRHIYPGTAKVGMHSYDLNSAFKNSAYAIGAQRSRLIPVSRIANTMATETLPTRYKHKPIKMATVSSNTIFGTSAPSSHAFFA